MSKRQVRQMANEYEKIALATRRKVSELTLDQQRQLLKLYENSIDNLATKITKSKNKSLNQRWLTDYQKELKRVSNELAKDVKASTEKAIGQAATIGTETEQQIMGKMFEYAGIDPGNHFTTMFSQVQNGVIQDIISGNLYKDKKTLSQRIWNHSGKFERDIQYVINQGILEKKSALELARDLEQFVREPAKRPWEWAKVYPNMGNTKIDYNAQRLARTSINHAYQNSSIQSSNMNPFVEGIEWRSAQIHGRTCDLCFERHGQIFPKDDVPLDHPSGLCTNFSYIPKSLDEVADELHDWLYGANNPVLDDWYNEYGDYFAFKKLGDSFNRVNLDLNSNINSPDFLKIKQVDNTNDDTVKVIQDELNLIPEGHREIIKDTVKEIQVVSEGNSRYDRKKGIVYILENPVEGEIIHELAHAIETKLNLYEREDFKNIVTDIIKNKGLEDIFFDSNTFVKPIMRIESKKFVSEYQGHIYDFNIDNYIKNNYKMEPKQLGDYFTEGYRVYVANPEFLKKKDKKLYQFIDKELGKHV